MSGSNEQSELPLEGVPKLEPISPEALTTTEKAPTSKVAKFLEEKLGSRDSLATKVALEQYLHDNYGNVNLEELKQVLSADEGDSLSQTEIQTLAAEILERASKKEFLEDDDERWIDEELKLSLNALKKKVDDQPLTAADIAFIVEAHKRLKALTKKWKTQKYEGVLHIKTYVLRARITALSEYSRNKSNWNWRWPVEGVPEEQSKVGAAKIQAVRIERFKTVLEDHVGAEFDEDEWKKLQKLLKSDEFFFADSTKNLTQARTCFKHLLKTYGVNSEEIAVISQRYFDRKYTRHRDGVVPKFDPADPAEIEETVSSLLDNTTVERGVIPPTDESDVGPPAIDDTRRNFLIAKFDLGQYLLGDVDEVQLEQFLTALSANENTTSIETAQALAKELFKNPSAESDSNQQLSVGPAVAPVVVAVEALTNKQRLEELQRKYAASKQGETEPTDTSPVAPILAAAAALEAEELLGEAGETQPDGETDGSEEPDVVSAGSTPIEPSDTFPASQDTIDGEFSVISTTEHAPLPVELKKKVRALLDSKEMRGLFSPMFVDELIDQHMADFIVGVTATNAEEKRIACWNHLYEQKKLADILKSDIKIVQLNEFFDRLYGTESGINAVIAVNKEDGSVKIVRKGDAEFDEEWAKVPQIGGVSKLMARAVGVFTTQGVPNKANLTFDQSIVGGKYELAAQPPTKEKPKLAPVRVAARVFAVLAVAFLANKAGDSGPTLSADNPRVVATVQQAFHENPELEAQMEQAVAQMPEVEQLVFENVQTHGLIVEQKPDGSILANVDDVAISLPSEVGQELAETVAELQEDQQPEVAGNIKTSNEQLPTFANDTQTVAPSTETRGVQSGKSSESTGLQPVPSIGETEQTSVEAATIVTFDAPNVWDYINDTLHSVYSVVPNTNEVPEHVGSLVVDANYPRAFTLQEVIDENPSQVLTPELEEAGAIPLGQITDSVKDISNAMNLAVNSAYHPDGTPEGSDVIVLGSDINSEAKLKAFAKAHSDMTIVLNQSQMERLGNFAINAFLNRGTRGELEEFFIQQLNAHRAYGGDANAEKASGIVTDYMDQLVQSLAVANGLPYEAPGQAEVVEQADATVPVMTIDGRTISLPTSMAGSPSEVSTFYQNVQTNKPAESGVLPQTEIDRIAVDVAANMDTVKNSQSSTNVAGSPTAPLKAERDEGEETPTPAHAFTEYGGPVFQEKFNSLLASVKDRLGNPEPGAEVSLDGLTPARRITWGLANELVGSPSTDPLVRAVVDAINEADLNDTLTDPDGVFGNLNLVASVKNGEIMKMYIEFLLDRTDYSRLQESFEYWMNGENLPQGGFDELIKRLGFVNDSGTPLPSQELLSWLKEYKQAVAELQSLETASVAAAKIDELFAEFTAISSRTAPTMTVK